MHFDDFLTSFDEEETAVQSITPLEVAELQPEDRLLVVTCNYQFAEQTKSDDCPADRFVLANDSVGFHLITALADAE